LIHRKSSSPFPQVSSEDSECVCVRPLENVFKARLQSSGGRKRRLWCCWGQQKANRTCCVCH